MKPLFARGFCSALCIVSFGAPLHNPITSWIEGAGARALGMGGAYVSQSADMSGLFWNPAGIVNSKLNLFTIGGDWLRHQTHSTFLGYNDSSAGEALRLLSLGILSIGDGPNSGLASALALHNAYNLDDYWQYNTTVFRNDDSISLRETYTSMGDLQFWTAGVGATVAEGVSIGGALSYVSGSQTQTVELRQTVNGQYQNPGTDSVDTQVRRYYSGFDLRFGLMYTPFDWLSAGARIAVPGIIAFVEKTKEYAGDSVCTVRQYGKLKTSCSGATGLSLLLPVGTVSGEVRFRAPYRGISDGTALSEWFTGSAIGFEMGPPEGPLNLRAGFSLDAFDPEAFHVTYNLPENGPTTLTGETTTGWKRTISAGVGCLIAPDVSMNFAYTYSKWSLRQINGLLEKPVVQRVVLELTMGW